MAKEKTDATSLFSAMNKNRAKTTEKVKTQKNNKIDDSNAQSTENAEFNGIIEDTDAEQSKKKEARTTKIVNEIFDNNSDVTNVIDNEKAPDSEGNAAKSAKGPKGADSVTGRSDEASDNVEIREEKEGKQDKDLQHIHIALPRDVFDKLEIAKKAYYNNKTTYIRNLILDDYEKNKDYYDRLPNIR